MSWYKSKIKKNVAQMEYITQLKNDFCMRSPVGQPIPYSMTEYQEDFHSCSINVLGTNAPDVLFIKARGISFTFSSCIELITSALWWPNQIFPVIAQRQDSSREILKTIKWLINNCNIKVNGQPLYRAVEMQESVVKFPNGSVIKPFPSGSASDAVRSLRLIRALIDEYAFQTRDRELLAAVQDAMIGELAQTIIGSTPCGRNNHFFELITNPVGYQVFRLPIFEEGKFNPRVSIFKQKLDPVAPWIDLKKLEVKRQRDANIFMQEQMCDFLDDSISYLPYSLIMRNVDEGMKNLKLKISRDLDFIYETENPMYMGIDVARNRDLTAITIFEKKHDEDRDANIYVMKYAESLKDMTIPKQQDIIDRLLYHFPSVMKVRVDMTGLGLGLHEFLKRKHGTMIEGIHFASKVKSAEAHQSIPIVERMAVNLKNLLQDGNVLLLDNELLIKHLNEVDYNFKAARSSDGHGDYFFSVCLALLPDRFKQNQIATFATNVSRAQDVQSDLAQEGIPVLSKDTTQQIVEKHQQPMTWDERLRMLRNKPRRRF